MSVVEGPRPVIFNVEQHATERPNEHNCPHGERTNCWVMFELCASLIPSRNIINTWKKVRSEEGISSLIRDEGVAVWEAQPLSDWLTFRARAVTRARSPFLPAEILRRESPSLPACRLVYAPSPFPKIRRAPLRVFAASLRYRQWSLSFPSFKSPPVTSQQKVLHLGT